MVFSKQRETFGNPQKTARVGSKSEGRKPMKKVFTIFVALILMMSTILMTPGIGGKVQAATIDGLTAVSVKYYNGSTEVNQITSETTDVRLYYDFDWGNTGSGKTVNFSLPAGIFANIQPVAAGTPITSTSAGPIGTYEITSAGAVTLNINSGLTGAKGQVLAIAKIDPNYKFEKNPTFIELADGKTVELKFSLANKDKKTATIDYAKREITWMVDVNTNLQSLKGATLSDPIPHIDLSYVADSLKVYKLSVDVNGNVAQGAENTAFMKEVNDNTVSVSFGDISEAYRVVFKTTVNASVIDKAYINKAIFNGKELTATADYKNLIPIEKMTEKKKR